MLAYLCQTDIIKKTANNTESLSSTLFKIEQVVDQGLIHIP